jgi:hypothetical protein
MSSSSLRSRALAFGLSGLSVGFPRNEAFDVLAMAGKGIWVGKDGDIEASYILGRLRAMEEARTRRRLVSAARSAVGSSAWETVLEE